MDEHIFSDHFSQKDRTDLPDFDGPETEMMMFGVRNAFITCRSKSWLRST
jgi:hypothetical protein